MIASIISLALKVHAAWPTAPLVDVAVASAAATVASTADVPAELLVAIAQHESDLEVNSVSWRYPGAKRVDILWDGVAAIPSRGMVCGLVQTVATSRARCAELVDPVEAMRSGAAELTEELARCSGDVSCALSCYAGGRAGIDAWRARRRTTATVFAAMFLRRAEQLGARFARPGS